MADTKLMTVTELAVTINHQQILTDISFDIAKNKITVITGPSGCGKSTLLKTLNRIIEEEQGVIAGEILLEEVAVNTMNPLLLRKKVGLVAQQAVMFPGSIEKNLALVLDYHFKLDKFTKQQRIKSCLEKVNLYDEVKNQLAMPAAKLSGGQKQRLSLARSLIVEPDILLLDEPCSALDRANIAVIEDTLLQLKKQYTILLVTHNLAQAERLADQRIHMADGTIVAYN